MFAESELRAMVREVLREALGARSGGAPQATVETVRITCDADLQALVARLAAPGGIEAVRTGRLRFRLAEAAPPAALSLPGAGPAPAATHPVAAAALDGVVTEKRLRGLQAGTRVRLAPDAVLTPLARDHARRHGITIERTAP
jgi:hypothetical protein